MKPIPIYIGYDPVEPVAYHVLCHSILSRTSIPCSIMPLKLSTLPELTRPREITQSNDFSFSRWLVPYLNNYEGHAIYMDCDMLCLDDIAKLWKVRNKEEIVQVVKHNFIPKTTEKYLGNKQIGYDRKNWSSMMLFNCSKCDILTPTIVNTVHGFWLHKFEWIDQVTNSFWAVGSLPINWNYLVGYNSRDMIHGDPSIVHFTEGGPWIQDDKRYSNQEFSNEWWHEYHKATYAKQQNT